MVIASGFVEANEAKDVDLVVNGLKARGVEVNGVKDDRIVFLVERDTTSEVKNELEALKYIEGIRSVYLTYYSLEDSDENPQIN